MRAYSSSVDGLFDRQFDSLTGVPNSSTYPNQTIIVPNTISELTAVSLEEAKSILPVYDNNSDGFITSLIRAVEEQVGRYIKIDLTRRQRTSYWKNPLPKLTLSFGPHGNITEVMTKDAFGNATTLTAGTNYNVYGLQYKEVVITSNPAPIDTAYVTYWSGYEDGECPDAIRMACIQELNFQYKNRQDANQPSITIINGLTAESRMLLETYIRRT